MSVPFYTQIYRSLGARFLTAMLIGAGIIAVVGAYLSYSISQSHIQAQLLQRSQLLASAINHSAMIARSDADLQHVVEEVLKDNKDILNIVVLTKQTSQIIASANSGKIDVRAIDDPHLFEELTLAAQNGEFGFHNENNTNISLIAPLWFAMGDGAKTATMSHDMTGMNGRSMEMKPSSTQPGQPTATIGNGTKNQNLSQNPTHMAAMGSKAGMGLSPPVSHMGDGKMDTMRHGNKIQNWINQPLGPEDYRGAIYLRMDRSDVAAAMSSLMSRLFPVSVLGVLTILVLAFWVLRQQVMLPITNLRDVMKRQQAGERQARVKHQSTDEFDEVASNFNAMLEFIGKRENQISKMAFTDSLTGAPNRSAFNTLIEEAATRARADGSRVSLLFLDLDRFKNVNDTKGHLAGDALLKLVVERISECLNEDDRVTRLSGDEFAIILANCISNDCVDTMCANIIRAIAQPANIFGSKIFVNATIGVSHFPEQTEDETRLIRYADTALRNAKNIAPGSSLSYCAEMEQRDADSQAMERELHDAIANNQFFLQYQPQINIKTGELAGAEALVRWNHPDHGMVPPNEFIPIAEASGLIIPIGEWVLRKACTQAKDWQEAGLPYLVMAVNVAPKQMRDSNFPELVRGVLEETGLDPRWLELELTESALMEENIDVSEVMDKLSALGVRLAIDDFGTGHSSLARLKNFPVDRLKIDQSFVRDIEQSSSDAAITRVIVELAKTMGMMVIAEGVETIEQLAYLVEIDCHEAQGYLYAKPLIADDFVVWYTSNNIADVTTQQLNDIIDDAQGDDQTAEKVA